MVLTVALVVLGAAVATPAGAALPATLAAVSVNPGPPTGLGGTAGDASAVLSWHPPVSAGASPVTGYLITATPGGLTARTTAVTAFTVGGLSNGTAYTFTVSAVNSAGSGPPSRRTAPLTPRAPTVPTTPAAPLATAGFQSATASWSPPPNDGGSPVTGYTVTAQPGGATVSTDGSARQAALTGLTNGAGYVLTVIASNRVGASRPAATRRVVPAVTVPAAPGSLQASSAGSGAVRLLWAPPANDGGSPVTGYTVTTSPGGGPPVALGATTITTTTTGLTAGTAYTFIVRAVNAVGAGPVATSAPTSPDAAAGSRTVVLAAGSVTALTAVQPDGSLRFTSPPAQVLGLRAGDIVVTGVGALTPSGLLRQVTGVTTVGLTTTVASTPAALDQALSAGDLAVGSTLTAGRLTRFTASQPGVQLSRPATAAAGAAAGFAVSINSDLYKDSKGATVHVGGSVTVTPTVTLSAAVTPLHTSSHFTASVQSTADVNLTAQVSHTVAGSIPLGTATYDPITFLVGPVPVVLVPVLTVTLEATGTVTVGVTTEASVSATYGVNLTSRDGAVTAIPISSHTSSFTPPTLFSQVSVQVGPKASLSLLLYGAVGPSVTAEYDLKLVADRLGNPWWTLSLGTSASVDYQLAILSRTLVKFSATLFTKTFPLANSGGPFMGLTLTPDPAMVAAGQSLQLHAAAQRSPSQPITWAVAAANGGSITTSGLYTAPNAPGYNQVTATSPASGLNPRTQGVLDVLVGSGGGTGPVDLSATVAGSLAPLQMGSPASMLVTVHNNGAVRSGGTTTVNISLRNMVAQSPPSEIASGSGWTCVGLTCTNLSVVPAGGALPVITVGFTVGTAPDPTIGGWDVLLQGSLDNPTDADTTNNAFTRFVPVAENAAVDLSATVAGSLAPLQMGSPASMLVTVHNNGAVRSGGTTTVNISLRNMVAQSPPSEIASGSGWTCVGLTCTNLSVVPAGGALPVITVGFTVGTAPDPTIGGWDVLLQGSLDNPTDADTTNNAFTRFEPVDSATTVDLGVTIADGGMPVPRGGTASVALQVANTGTQASAGLTTVSIPGGGLTLISVGGTGWTCDLTAAVCTYPAPIPAGGFAPTVTVVGSVGTGSSGVLYYVTAVHNANASNAANSDVRLSTPIVAGPVDLSVTIADGGMPVPRGGTASVALQVANTGTQASAGLTTVSIPGGGLTLISVGGTGWTCDLTAAVCTYPAPIPAGGFAPTVTVVGSVGTGSSGVLYYVTAVQNANASNTANDSDSRLSTPIVS